MKTARLVANPAKRPTQKDMFYQAGRDLTDAHLTMLELLYGANPINDYELAKAIERRPAIYSRYTGYLGRRVGAGGIYWGA